MDKKEIEQICALIPPDTEMAKTPFNFSHKTLRAFKDIKKAIVSKDTDEYTKLRLKRGYDRLLKLVEKLRDLLFHKSALLYKMGPDRKDSTPEMEIELAEVDNALKQLRGALDEQKATIQKVVGRPIQGPQRLVSDQHWAQLSQKAKLSKAINQKDNK